LRSYPILRVRGLRTFEHAAQIYHAAEASPSATPRTA
jgi:hypothetical protein